MSYTEKSLSELLTQIVAIQRRALVDGDLEGALSDALQLLVLSSGVDAAILRTSKTLEEKAWHTAASANSAAGASHSACESEGVVDHCFDRHLQEQLTALCDAAARSCETASGETEVQGIEQTALLTAVPLTGPTGQLVAVLGLAGKAEEVYDICQSTQYQPLLDLCVVLVEAAPQHRSETLGSFSPEDSGYRHLLENKTEACFLTDSEGKVVDVNDKACSSLGYSREELVGMRPTEFDDNFNEEDIQELGEHLNCERPFLLETNHRRKDGTTFPVVVRARQFRIRDDVYTFSQATEINSQDPSREVLRDDQLRLELALDASRMGVWEWNRDNGKVYWSHECLHLLGVSSLGDTIDSFTSLLHPEDADSFLAHVEEKTPFYFEGVREYRLLGQDDSPRWIECSCLAMPTGPKESVKIIGTMRDVTQRKRDAERLQEMQQEFSTIIEHSPVAIFVKDLDGRYTLANPVARAALSTQEVLGRTDEELLDARSAQALRDHDQQVLDSGRVLEFEDTVERDGYSRTYLAVKFPLYDLHGHPRGLCGIATDITERKSAECLLRLNKKTVDHAGFGVSWIKRDGTFHYVNDWSCRFLGHSREELLGMSVLQFSDHTMESWLTEFERVKREGRIRGETYHRHQDGTTCPIEVTSHYDEYEGEEYMFVIVQDITDRKEAEKRLEEQSAELLHASRLSMLGQMVATMSHEVAQPLSAIGNYSAACMNILHKENPADTKLAEYVCAIQKQYQRCGEILARLRDFSRTTAFRQVNCDLRELLDESVQLVKSDLSRHDVSVRFEVPANSPSVYVDRIQLQQVVVNLLTNARNAMGKTPVGKKLIILRSFENEQQVGFSVVDSGTGLKEEQRERLFDPFFTTREEGMGLGLSICQTIVQKHEGQIEATNNKGDGACFTVKLPKVRTKK